MPSAMTNFTANRVDSNFVRKKIELTLTSNLVRNSHQVCNKYINKYTTEHIQRCELICKKKLYVFALKTVPNVCECECFDQPNHCLRSVWPLRRKIVNKSLCMENFDMKNKQTHKHFVIFNHCHNNQKAHIYVYVLYILTPWTFA